MRNTMLRIWPVPQAIERGASAFHEPLSQASSFTPNPTLTFDDHSSQLAVHAELGDPTSSIAAYLTRTLESSAASEATANIS